MKKALSIALLVSMIFMVSSCCGCGQTKKLASQKLSATKWQLGGEAGDDRMTLEFLAENAVAGKGDCNRFKGTYTGGVSGSLGFTGIISTRAMCPNHEEESKFIGALNKADSYVVKGDNLFLYGKSELLLTLVRVKAK